MTENNNDLPIQPPPAPSILHNNDNLIPTNNGVLLDSRISEPTESNHFAVYNNEIHGIGLSETTAIRLYNSVHRNSSIRLDSGLEAILSNTTNAITTNVSWLSLTDQSDTCRICRYKRNDTELIECPCHCSGTMGYIHIKCLKRWMRLRNDDHCEICKESFNFPQDTKNYYRLFTAFFQPQYLGACIKIVLNLITLTPLAYFTMNQLINTMDTFNDDQPVKILLIGPAMLLATSIYFLFYFEWALSCFIRLKNILKHWWNFGDQDDEDYSLMADPESDIGLFDFDF